MEQYFVIEISEGDSKIAGKAIYGYATEREALATFHQKMATAMKSDLFTGELVMVTDKYGSQIKRERWDVPANPVEEE